MNNANVFYELALRHAFRKPVIQIKDSEDYLPFDIQGTRTISFDYRFFDSVEECKKEVVKQINAIESDPNKVESPVTYTLDYHSMTKQDAESKYRLQLDSQIQTLTSELNDSKRRLTRPSVEVSGLGFQTHTPIYAPGTLFDIANIPPPPAPPPAPKSDKKDEDENN